MGSLAVGSVVLVNFPFANLKGYKKRPALVLAPSSLDTVILCQITSRRLPNVPAVELSEDDFARGRLPSTSYARPDKLFTVDSVLAKQAQLGLISSEKLAVVKAAARELFA